MSNKTTVHIKSIYELHQFAGVQPPKHPLFSIHKLEDLKLTGSHFPERMTYDFYTVGLKKNLTGYIKYGRTSYDFQEGALGFTAPYQLMEFNKELIQNANGWVFFFQKEFLNGSNLYDKINEYGFFEYQINEGLHLSKTEEESIDRILEDIEKEYKQPIDVFSKQVVLSSLELLLTFSHRYYSRQFIVRNDTDPSVFSNFKKQLRLVFTDDKHHGLPTVELMASKLHLSANYLSDYLKSTTGKTALDHIHNHIIEIAKKNLLVTNKSISEIAFEIGFEYPHYFSRLFKKKTGLTPSEFRITPD